ncbi:transcription initiation factor TFIID subunit 4 isoform X2 [Nothobranchius furzeri]|uniref:transcription initiation factor TFIID subunit 4 isoform X2 n=1 Tax=Nothobranchius furzeri TaxID=105023 RepID=UPI0024044E2C|nr:transcription initiation factor TFIID subunit 4 isoform X2 [Nothobranchius furzeri]
MATNKVAPGSDDSCGAAKNQDTSIQVRFLQVPLKGGPITTQHTAPKGERVSPPQEVMSMGQGSQPASCPGNALVATRTTPSSVMVVSKPSTQGGVRLSNPTPGRTVTITVPRSAASQLVAPAQPRASAPQLPTNVQIPAGMMLISSDSGQLMLVSQQAIMQAQQGARIVSSQAPRVTTQQISTAVGSKSNEKVTMIRRAAPSTFHTAPLQETALVLKTGQVIGVATKPAVVLGHGTMSERGTRPHTQSASTDTKKEPQITFNKESMESVKKCKNFLVTLIKLASSDSRSPNMADNVRGLVKNLLDGKIEAEEFTERLYDELKSTPQPCLVPFLKKSLPAVRLFTADPQLFIQQASSSVCKSRTVSSNSKLLMPNAGDTIKTSQQAKGLALRLGLMAAQSRNCISTKTGPTTKPAVVQLGKQMPGTFSTPQSVVLDPTQSTKRAFKETPGCYKEDDDINDVASMAGVNLREENAQILTTTVGSVVQSCHDQLFLSPSSLLSQILHTGQAVGVTDVGPEVVALVSHAAREYLCGLVEKLTVIAEHRKAGLKQDEWHTNHSDVRSQLRFLEEVERLKKKRKDEEEREKLLRMARSRSHSEDPQLQQLKQRAKELQQIEEAQLQQKEANLTALAAIGPRKRRAMDQAESQVTLLPRPVVQRVTRITLRDLLLCMEQEPFLRHSLTHYKAML